MFIDIILLLKIVFFLLFTQLVEVWPFTTQWDVNRPPCVCISLALVS